MVAVLVVQLRHLAALLLLLPPLLFLLLLALVRQLPLVKLLVDQLEVSNNAPVLLGRHSIKCIYLYLYSFVLLYWVLYLYFCDIC